MSRPSFFSISDHPKADDFEDEWDYIQKLDQGLAGLRDGNEAAASDGQGSVFGDDSDHVPTPVEMKCKILSKADILQRLEDKITRVSTVLVLSRSEAAIILRHFNWSVSTTEDEWLASEEKVRMAVGLFDNCVFENPNAPYISNAINEDPESLASQCPGSSTHIAVGLNMSSEEDKTKFDEDLIRSYVDSNRKAKWCPAPGCDYAVFLSDASDHIAVTCRCFYNFCWSCTKEGHAPVDCGTVVRWMAEASAQSENWVLVNTWPCPACTNLINQNQKSSRVTCDLCGNTFCCDCGGIWSEHEVWGGPKYYCRRDESLKPDGYRYEDARKRATSRRSLEIYNHFHGRWNLNESSRKKALADLKRFQKNDLTRISDVLILSEKELEFVKEAHLQIVECYRVLKWTNVYAYYLNEDEHAKSSFIIFMEEQAKNLVQRVEKHVAEVGCFLYNDHPIEKFIDFREKLLLLTRVARNYFDRMVEALKAGLPEVVSTPRTTPIPVVPELHMSLEERSTGSSPMPNLDPGPLSAQVISDVPTPSPTPTPTSTSE